MKLRRIGIGLAMMAVAIAVLLVAVEQPGTLERKAILHFKVEEEPSVAGTRLHLSGLCGESGYAVRSVRQEIAGDELYLEIAISSVVLRKGPGSFDEWVTVPPSVRSVSLGKEKAMIWQRGKRL